MSQENTKFSEIFDWFESIVVFTLVATMLILMFVVNFSSVSGISMQNTLQAGDRVFVQILAYSPKHGDVIITDSLIDFGNPLVKRVIAMGGDTVDINADTGEVIVNGQVLNEPYIGSSTNFAGNISYPLTVPGGQLFIMGDNRQASNDSRYKEVGFIDERDVVGKVLFRVSPFNNMGLIT